MKKVIYTVLLLLVGSQMIHAQEVMSLTKAITIGLENNFGIKINEVNIQIAANNDTWARAGKGPIIDLTTSLSNTVVNDNNPASFLQGTYYAGSLSPTLSAQWIVFNGGRTRILKDQLGTLVDQQRLMKDAEVHDLMRDIHQAYYDVIFQQEQLSVLESILALSSDRLRYEQTKKEFGSSNSYNLLQFESAIVGDSTNILSQRQRVEVAKRTLYNVLDIIGLPNYEFPEKLNVVIEDIDGDKLGDILSEENYTMKSLEMIATLNRLNTLIEETTLKPTVAINGSVGFSKNAFKFYADNPETGEPFPFNWSNRWNGNVGATFSWNLYDGGVKRANIENAKLQEEVDQLSLLEAKATLSNQLEILISNYNNQLDILKISDENVDISQRNLDMTEERFKAGLITSLDYRNVQNQYLNAAFSKVTAIYNLIITKVEIDWLVGRYEN